MMEPHFVLNEPEGACHEDDRIRILGRAACGTADGLVYTNRRGSAGPGITEAVLAKHGGTSPAQTALAH